MWPFSNEHGRADRVIVVAQKAEVHTQVANQVAKHAFADRGGVSYGCRHQLGGGGGDQIVQRAWHSLTLAGFPTRDAVLAA